MEFENIIYEGVKTNNLKNIHINIPKNKITCIIGPSGSGKSSLVFDTIYQISEVELNQLNGKSIIGNEYIVDKYYNIIPTIALEQNNYNNNPRSTVATYYGIDKIFAYIFLYYNNISTNIFTFNKIEYACKKCNGLGYEFTLDKTKIIDNNYKIKDVPFKCWRNSEINYYKELIVKYCKDEKIDEEKYFYELNFEDQDKLLNYKSLQKYKINYKQNSRMRVKTDFYVGPLNQMQKKLFKNNIETKDINFLKKEKCSVCNGYRFSKKVLKYKLFDKSIGELYTMEVEVLKEWILNNIHLWKENKWVFNAFDEILNFIDKIIKLRLGYINLNRSITSLSGGELQRLRISRVLNTQFNNILYIFDEPSANLHPYEYNNIIKSIIDIKNKGNTIILIDHNPKFINISDNVVKLGPKSGVNGGYIVENNNEIYSDFEKPIYKFFETKEFISIKNESYNNILNINVDIPKYSLLGICGVSGSGKTSFLKGILPKYLNKYILVNQKPINGNSYSVVGTYVELISIIKMLFSKENNVDQSLFSFYSNAKGACKNCNGKGNLTYQSKFEETISCKCYQCDGIRYNNEALMYTLYGYNIYEILNKSVDELIYIFDDKYTDIRETLELMSKLGLGYITLFQSLKSLSGGEIQRLKLVKSLKSKYDTIILDEPFKGLGNEEIFKLINVLYKIIENKKTVIITEHNTIALNYCSYIIEFGPESGKNGGRIIFNGVKDEIYKCDKSKTKNFLKNIDKKNFNS